MIDRSLTDDDKLKIKQNIEKGLLIKFSNGFLVKDYYHTGIYFHVQYNQMHFVLKHIDKFFPKKYCKQYYTEKHVKQISHVQFFLLKLDTISKSNQIKQLIEQKQIRIQIKNSEYFLQIQDYLYHRWFNLDIKHINNIDLFHFIPKGKYNNLYPCDQIEYFIDYTLKINEEYTDLLKAYEDDFVKFYIAANGTIQPMILFNNKFIL